MTAIPDRPEMDRVTQLCANLIRFDTTNFGPGESKGEAHCAQFITTLLCDHGYAPHYLESAPGRGNVVVRVCGQDRQAPAVLAHAHLDVVPAAPNDWSFNPFSGTIANGFVHGRGAADMKDFAAALLTILIDWADRGQQPEHDLVIAFVADEEVDGTYGAKWLATKHPDLFTGVTWAIGESGGARIPWQRASDTVNFYPIATAERGSAHTRLTATGTAGHGSRTQPDNAVVHLIHTLARLADHQWPIILTQPVAEFLDGVRTATGLDLPCGSDDELASTLQRLGPLAPSIDRAFRVSTTPTVLDAGYKTNVIPGTATAEIDVRLLPGTETDTMKTIDKMLGPQVTRQPLTAEPPVTTPSHGPFFDRLTHALADIDPQAQTLPYCAGGGTDAKTFTQLGIHCYGFAPSRPDAAGTYPAGQHGIDERVPIASLNFAVTVLHRLFRPAELPDNC